MHCYTCMHQIIPDEGRHGEVPYVLFCQPLPGGFLTGVVAGAKTLLIDLMKQSRNYIVNSSECFLQVMHGHVTHFFVLYTPHGYFLGIPSSHWLLVTSLLCHTTSCQGSVPFGMSHPIRGFPTLTHPCTCILIIRRGIPKFILHPTFREETSYAHSTPAQAVHHIF